MDGAEKSRISWKARKKAIRHKWLRPFIFVEWLCERLSDMLRRWAFLEILELVGRLAIVIAVIMFFAERGERQKAKHYQAWEVINAAKGSSCNGGRIAALQDLAEDNISLAGVDLSNAYLCRLKFKKGASLYEANLTKANLFEANLACVYFADANLSEANCFRANLAGANFLGANLSRANLAGANFSGAALRRANLNQAILANADFSRADLREVDLHMADLAHANFSGACLLGANLSGASLIDAKFDMTDLRSSNLKSMNWKRIKNIEYANIFQVENPPDGFIEWAKENGAVSIEDYGEWKKLVKERIERKKTDEQ